MLPKSSDTGAGYISLWQWIKIGINLWYTPKFDPLKVKCTVLTFSFQFIIIENITAISRDSVELQTIRMRLKMSREAN